MLYTLYFLSWLIYRWPYYCNNHPYWYTQLQHWNIYTKKILDSKNHSTIRSIACIDFCYVVYLSVTPLVSLPIFYITISFLHRTYLKILKLFDFFTDQLFTSTYFLQILCLKNLSHKTFGEYSGWLHSKSTYVLVVISSAIFLLQEGKKKNRNGKKLSVFLQLKLICA